jgi:hypothetical protein
MSLRRRLFVSLAALAAVIVPPVAAVEDTVVIDDFSIPGQSALGTQWQGFSDRVVGGISSMQAGYEPDGDGLVLRMVGDVSLENNGGFVQVRLPLAARGSYDASAHTGIAIEITGEPGSYYLHLRTRNSRLPWQYYEARLDVTTEWQRLEVPFSSFSPVSLRGALDPSELESLGVVGGKTEFRADISVRLLEFY